MRILMGVVIVVVLIAVLLHMYRRGVRVYCRRGHPHTTARAAVDCDRDRP